MAMLFMATSTAMNEGKQNDFLQKLHETSFIDTFVIPKKKTVGSSYFVAEGGS
jgi:hypothetical protein